MHFYSGPLMQFCSGVDTRGAADAAGARCGAGGAAAGAGLAGAATLALGAATLRALGFAFLAADFFAALFFAAERFFVRPGAAIFAFFVFLVFDLAILAMIVLPIVSAQAFSTVYPFRPTMALPWCSP